MKRSYALNLTIIFSLIVLFHLPFKPAYAASTVNTCSILSIPGETYYVTQNIVTNLPGICININANNITLDCQWHTIQGNKEQLGVVLNSVSGVTVRNCTLEKFQSGLSDVEGNQNNIEKNKSRYNLYSGFNIQANNSRVFHNIAHENGTTGIGIRGNNNDVYYNRAYSNTENGMVLFEHGGNYVFKNLTQKNNLSGILINNSDKNQLIRNRTNSNMENGVYTLGNSDENLIAGNHAELNAEYGFKDNTAVNNMVDNDYLRNTCKSNQIGGSNNSNLCTPQP